MTCPAFDCYSEGIMAAFLRRKSARFDPFAFNEFTILGVFVAIVVFGLLYGIVTAAIQLAATTAQEPQAPAVVAPTAEEYEWEAKSVLGPFLAQANAMSTDDLAAPDPMLARLVETTQTRMLGIRVPNEYRDFHLSSVLLLEKWKRAIGGSAPDRDTVLERTKQLAADNPWLVE